MPGMPDWLPLLGFAIVASVTPGPNVLMVAAAAAGHGLRAVLPHMLGITFGFTAMIALVGLGLAWPLAIPAVHRALQLIAAVWMLWLAWKIATAPPPGEGGARPPLGFVQAALFQWVNPKAWMVAGAAIAGYTLAGAPLLPQVLAIALVFGLVSMPCLLVWAGLGAGARRVLGDARRLRRFNLAMGALLALSVLPLLR
jgi:threonine/homoserine/homoserine lactone efflux protein